MKRWTMMLPFVIVIAMTMLLLLDRPSQTTAGGLPCFLCHGVRFQGSDLAPPVAGTKLTDEEIINQIQNPRGLMPAFPEFANQDIVDFIRSLPAGEPTATLLPESRSAALATLAAVAASRSTEFARIAQQGAGATPSPSPLPPTETPIPSGAASLASSSPSTNASPSKQSSSSTRQSNIAASLITINAITLAVGLLLATIGGVWMVWQRRRPGNSVQSISNPDRGA